MIDYRKLDPLRTRVYEYMLDNAVNFTDAAPIFNFNSRQAFHEWMHATRTNRHDEIDGILNKLS